jgi:hypothetical protein
MCHDCCTLHICPDLKYIWHLRPNIQSMKWLILYTEVPSPKAEQVLPVKIIFSFTLLPQIRQNNEDLRNMACDIVLSEEQLLTFWRITYSGSGSPRTVILFLHCLALKMEGLWSFAIWGMTHQMTASHSEDLNLSNAAVRMSYLGKQNYFFRKIVSALSWLSVPYIFINIALTECCQKIALHFIQYVI